MKFFHMSTINIRKTNKIIILQGLDGKWYKEHNDIMGEINNYYEKLFKTSNPSKT